MWCIWGEICMGTIVQTHGDSIRRLLKYGGAQEILSPLRWKRVSLHLRIYSARERVNSGWNMKTGLLFLSVVAAHDPSPPTIYVFMHLASFADSEAVHQNPAKACSHLAG